MTRWWSYGLADAQIFSARAYDSLVERCMREAWPAQPLAVALGVAVLVVLLRWRPAPGARALAAAAALACVGVAAGWLTHCYAEIHWASGGIAIGFALQALLLAVAAAWPGAWQRAGTPGARGCAGALLAFALAVLPWLSSPAGGGAWRAEVFGLMPAPVIAASLAVVPLAVPVWRLVLLPLPLAGTLLESVTLASIDRPQWMLLPLAAMTLAAMLLVLRRGRRVPPSS